MVATRHSLPSAASTSPPPVPTDRKALLALKRLQVDGTDALRSGHLPAKPPTSSPAVGQTYHWRGSVYAVTGNEPEEWLTAQPKRYKQQWGTAPADEEEQPQDEEQETVIKEQPTSSPAVGETYYWRGSTYAVTGNEPQEWLKAQSKRKQRSSHGVSEAREQEPESTGKDKPTRKRRRQDDEEGEQEKEEATRCKRQRRSSPKRRSTVTTTTTPKGRRRQPPQPSENEGRMQRARLYDYTRVGQPSEHSCAEAARRTAHLNGYAINPIPKKVIAAHMSRKLKNNVVAMARINDQMARLLRRWRQRKYEWICSRTPRHLHETNEEIVELKRQIDTDEQLPMTAVQIASEVNNLPTIPTPASSAESAADTTASPAVEATTSPPSSLDPLAPSPESLSPAAPKTPSDELLPFAGSTKNVQKLRFGGFPTDGTSPETGRAENAIHIERQGGESRSARRRRVRRELALVRGWQVEETTAERSPGQASSS